MKNFIKNLILICLSIPLMAVNKKNYPLRPTNTQRTSQVQPQESEAARRQELIVLAIIEERVRLEEIRGQALAEAGLTEAQATEQRLWQELEEARHQREAQAAQNPETSQPGQNSPATRILF